MSTFDVTLVPQSFSQNGGQERKEAARAGVSLLVHQTSRAAFGIAGHVFLHILSLANKKL